MNLLLNAIIQANIGVVRDAFVAKTLCVPFGIVWTKKIYCCLTLIISLIKLTENKLSSLFFIKKNQQNCLDFVGKTYKQLLEKYYYYVFDILF